MADSDTKGIYTLLAEAQAEMGQPVKDKTATVKTRQGYTYSYEYSSLASIEAIVKPPLCRRGVFVGQRTVMHELLGVCIQTFVASGSTELVLDHEPYQLDKDPKENGARTTYAKRYGMCKAFCLEGVDDTDAQEVGAQGTPMMPPRPHQLPASQTAPAPVPAPTPRPAPAPQAASHAEPVPHSVPQMPIPEPPGHEATQEQIDNRRAKVALVADLKREAIANGVRKDGINEWYRYNVGDLPINKLDDGQLQTVINYLGQIVQDTADGHLAGIAEEAAQE